MFLKSNFLVWLCILFLFHMPAEFEHKEVYASLVIPKIHLKADIYSKNAAENTLKHGIYLAKESRYLEEEQSMLILASHSGNSSISLFKHLEQLKLNDVVRIERKDKLYFYKISSIYYEKKDGILSIKKPSEDSLALITCTKNSNTLQVVYIATRTGMMEKK